MAYAPVPRPVYDYAVRGLVEIRDGDTAVFSIDVGFRWYPELPLRLRGIDTPELGTPEGEAAREFLIAWCAKHRLRARTFRHLQSFDRWLADIYDADTGEDLAGALRAAGHVKR